MKTYFLVSLVILFSSIINAQMNPGRMFEYDQNKDFIQHQLRMLQNALNEHSNTFINSIITEEAISDKKAQTSGLLSTYKIVEINPLSINITNNYADVICKNQIYLDDKNSLFLDDTLKLIKDNDDWVFNDLGRLASITKETLTKISSDGIESITGYDLITPFVNDRASILDAHYLSPEIFEINANVTQNYTSRQLYGFGSETDVAIYVYSVNPANTINGAIFTLDTKWNRIVFSKTGSNDTKSYGDNPNNIKFINPTAIDVNEFGEVFVLDSYTKQLHKLQYSYYNNSIDYLGVVNIANNFLIEPLDFDYCSAETGNWRSDDFILITDGHRKSILKFSYNGTFQNEFTSYSLGGITYNIGYPTRIAKNWSLQFIDASKNYIISAEIISNTIVCYNVTKLPSNYRPTDISMDASYNIVVTDGIGMIHKFDFYGKYICSYKNTSYPFYNTRRISNAILSNPDHGVLPAFINDGWSQTRGSKRFLPGADALDLQVNEVGSYFQAKCKFTDKCYYKLEIIKVSNNAVIFTKNSNTYIGGESDLISIATGLFTCGSYKFRVSVLPYYNDLYGNYAVGWKSREIQFTPLKAPIIAYFTQNPAPICKGAGGNAYANLSQGNGALTYNWFSTNQPSNITIDPQGSRCQIIFHNVASVIPGDAPVWELGCTVSNVCGSYTKTYTPSLDNGCNGCPTLSFDQNGTLVDENTLLITSMSNPDKDVTDYYLINTPLSAVNNKINLTIHEPQTEHTWFDNISLIEARANPDENIVVNDEGQVINYKGILPATIMLNGQEDITEKLLSVDSLLVELFPGDALTITRSGNSIEGDDRDVVLGGEEPPIVQKKFASMMMNVITKKHSDSNVKGSITESNPITNFFLRPHKSIISKKFRNFPAGTIEITINKKLTLDYFVFVSDLKTVRTRNLPLLTAVHNLNGDIKTKLISIDENYSEMYPTERIDLSFSTTTTTGNRAYILKSVGRYEIDTTYIAKLNGLAKNNDQPILPTENKLYDNFPNPFNPSTTIKYSIKDAGIVSLKIFNTLGEEIATLVDEEKIAGNYEVDFNASSLASGVYIYKIQSGSFINSKKMLLLK